MPPIGQDYWTSTIAASSDVDGVALTELTAGLEGAGAQRAPDGFFHIRTSAADGAAKRLRRAWAHDRHTRLDMRSKTTEGTPMAIANVVESSLGVSEMAETSAFG